MLKDNVAEPTLSEWDAPIFFAPRKDCSLWFWVNYQKLNADAVQESYPDTTNRRMY